LAVLENQCGHKQPLWSRLRLVTFEDAKVKIL